jgi:hypothetical protein
MESVGLTIGLVVAAIFFVMAKINARPGFNAILLALLLAFTPTFSHVLPGQGDSRDMLTVAIFLISATVGTALGGGLKARHDDHDHDHFADHGDSVHID